MGNSSKKQMFGHVLESLVGCIQKVKKRNDLNLGRSQCFKPDKQNEWIHQGDSDSVNIYRTSLLNAGDADVTKALAPLQPFKYQ